MSHTIFSNYYYYYWQKTRSQKCSYFRPLHTNKTRALELLYLEAVKFLLGAVCHAYLLVQVPPGTNMCHKEPQFRTDPIGHTTTMIQSRRSRSCRSSKSGTLPPPPSHKKSPHKKPTFLRFTAGGRIRNSGDGVILQSRPRLHGSGGCNNDIIIDVHATIEVYRFLAKWLQNDGAS